MGNSETCREIFKGQVRPVSCRDSEFNHYTQRVQTNSTSLLQMPPRALGFGLSEKEIQGPTLIGLALWEEGLRNASWAQVSV